MDIDKYFEVSGDQIIFSRRQSSDFAKQIAGDFNPLHNTDSKRFCVPGDLLFATFLSRHGVFETMTFDFMSMVDAGSPLTEVKQGDCVLLTDSSGRQFLSVGCGGPRNRSPQVVNGLTRAYVQFSGQTFPYLLVDLMRKNDVMINPARPLVIYKSMELSLFTSAVESISLRFSGAQIERDGKKAAVELNFDIYAAEALVGKGQKKMMLGGLRAFDENEMSSLVSDYQRIKEAYSSGIA